MINGGFEVGGRVVDKARGGVHDYSLSSREVYSTVPGTVGLS